MTDIASADGESGARDPLPAADGLRRRRRTGDRGAVDQQASERVRQRIRDLQEDIDAAEADHDYSRADRARLEMDALVDHLTAALGLGGRARRCRGGSAERARSAVTQRIRRRSVG